MGRRDVVLYRRSSDVPRQSSADRRSSDVPRQSSADNRNIGNLTNIHECHPLYDPLQYVLLFPHGDKGWHLGVTAGGSKTQLSPMLYYAHRLMDRGVFSAILYGGRLLQQYIVDMYAKIESERLSYIRFNQSSLHAELYQGLSDAVSGGDASGATVGRLIVLPASFTGSPRSMHQNYQDAMAIVRKYGKPDLFITLTCNPNWPEIRSALRDGQIPADRPDIVARVFHLKLKELMNMLTHQQVMGRVVAYVYVIEHQKRGLPHSHILLILAPEDKPRSTDDYDRFVCAELPDKQKHPQLYETVAKNMIHGPCGVLNPHSVCMRDGNCTKNFPKDPCATTTSTGNSYPVYRRRKNGTTVIRSISRHKRREDIELDSRWVVPYNPYLLTRFDAHMNVEICTSVTAVKYLYKYIYKGHDRVVAELSSTQANEGNRVRTVDEVKKFVDAIFVSPPEACWRIFHYPLHDRSPSIQRLTLHLPDQQAVVYRDGGAAAALENVKGTTLTAWFKSNEANPEDRNVLYSDFPQSHTYDTRTATWRARKAGNVIGRMYTASPVEGERYYMRLLLTRLTGATSFTGLRTLADGHVCATFKEAALRHGLLDDDEAWHDCLSDAADFKMPSQLRQLLAIILIFCEPAEPAKLWHQHEQALCEDLQFAKYGNNNTPEDDVINSALLELERHLQVHGKHVSDYEGFPRLRQHDLPPAIVHEFTAFIPREEAAKGEHNVALLNTSQRHVFDTVMSAVEGRSPQKIFFIDGPGGTGKTFVYNTLAATIRGSNKIVISVATSGIAAEQLDISRTAHSAFKVPIPIEKSSTCNIGRNSAQAHLIREAILIIFDEAPMADRKVIECIERTLRDITGCDDIFGGKVVVFGGDFRQILPVVRHGSRADIVNASLNRYVVKKPYGYIHVGFFLQLNVYNNNNI